MNTTKTMKKRAIFSTARGIRASYRRVSGSHNALANFAIAFVFSLSLTLGAGFSLPAAADAAPGPGVSSDAATPQPYAFEFSGWDGPDIDVFVYEPAAVHEKLQVVFIMHGNKREAERYLRDWIDEAEAFGFLLVAPEFPRPTFSGSREYNLGNVYREGGRNKYGLIRENRWTFSAIEPLFDEIKRRTGVEAENYSIFGHSAGAQFVHRFVYYKPDARYDIAVAANAGWYTLPSVFAKWPYGLGDTILDEADIKAALGKNLVVLLGTADTDTESSSLRTTDEANAQGPHRFARGRTFYEVAQRTAQLYETDFGWRIFAAPDVAHSNPGIAPFAARLIGSEGQ